MQLFWKECTAVALAIACVGMATHVEARPQRPGQMPNGTVNFCANCHVDANGGGPRNSFGIEVGTNFLTTPGAAGGVVWGPDLAKLDSDGDGFTNGEELGDPEGTWKAGDPAPGDPSAVTLPGDPDSHPPDEPTAVETSTWAKIKGFVQDLAE